MMTGIERCQMAKKQAEEWKDPWPLNLFSAESKKKALKNGNEDLPFSSREQEIKNTLVNKQEEELQKSGTSKMCARLYLELFRRTYCSGGKDTEKCDECYFNHFVNGLGRRCLVQCQQENLKADIVCDLSTVFNGGPEWSLWGNMVINDPAKTACCVCGCDQRM